MGCNTLRLPAAIAGVGFQYPLRVEVGCNLTAQNHLSQSCCSFSTLYGSKWVATEWRTVKYASLSGFQYPLRVEVGCNARLMQKFLAWHEFQYPLRVEVGCNMAMETHKRAGWTGFSTLYGSKWVATLVWIVLGKHYIEFQYPLRVEVGCNCFRFRTRKRKLLVSVPSTGRSGLQRGVSG